MARLIPSFTDDRTPPGERDVFNMFASGPDDWVILHSLDLAPFNRGIRTEVDFVALVPDTGIVCIEVKSHKDISFKDDCWYPPEIKRSPFKQATDGRYTFHRRLTKIAPIYREIPVVHLCIFPNARFDLSANLSVQPWELMDERVFRSFGTAKQFCADLESRMLSGISSDSRLIPLEFRMSEDRLEAIVGLCVPVQRHHPNRRSEIERRERDAERVLREQQKAVLRLAFLNRQLIVDGPAGTGKTLIAMEVARRKATQGVRTGIFCFNRLVGNWMREKFERTQPRLPNLVVGPAIKIMAEMSGIKIPESPDSDYWENELPKQLEERLTDPDFRVEAGFDYLVLDEAQDLLARPQIWNCLSQFLAGGFKSGNYALFGDFKNQVLEHRSLMCRTLDELESLSHPTHWELSENCRNYQIIGDTAAMLAGFGRSIYTGYLRTGGSVRNYDVHFYENGPSQVEMLRKVLTEFRAQGYKSSEITVLSFRAPEMSAAESLRKEGFQMKPLWRSEAGIGFGSINAFKGMESKIVILTDLLLDDVEMHRTLFYVGMTRATESVRIICDTRSKRTLTQWLAKGALHA